MQLLFAALLTVSTASAHNMFQKFEIPGQRFDRSYVRQVPNNQQVQSSASDSDGRPGLDFAQLGCNFDGENPAKNKAEVEAGSEITLEFHPGTGSDTGSMDISHHGPAMLYLGKVDDALTSDGKNVNWFKVFEEGIVDANKDVANAPDNKGLGYWATDKLRDNGGKFTAKIPKNIPSGDYLLRPEIVALHGASNTGGAQLYFGCGQITVKNGAGGNPATVSFPGAYNPEDKGFHWSMWGVGNGGNSGYKPPGPPVYEDSPSNGPVAPVLEKPDPVPTPESPKAEPSPPTPINPEYPDETPSTPPATAPAPPSSPATATSKDFWNQMSAWFKKFWTSAQQKGGNNTPRGLTTMARYARMNGLN